MLLSSLSILLIIWLDLCISQLAPTSFKSNPREWGFHCPNDCMKRGICISGDVCKCQDNWKGPDCSIAVCPRDYSYNSKPSDFNIGHTVMTECSNQGLCNITTGICQCFPGYEGTACQKQSCIDSSGQTCSNHGTCMTIDDIYKYYTVKVSTSPSIYSTWDAGHTSACVCDEGYTGQACQIRMCPKGDDPLTPKTGYKVFTITTSATSGTLYGYFLLLFNQYSIKIPAKASLWTESACVTSLQSIPVIGKVTCTQSAINAFGGATYTVTIKSYPLFPKDNNIFPLDGTVNTGIFGCDVSMASSNGASCVITDATPANTLLPEYVMCSNRGQCNGLTGDCICTSPLFYGPNCGAYSIVDITTKVPNPVDVLSIEVNNAVYTHTILALDGVVGGNVPQNNGPGILPWIFNTTSMRVLDYSDNSAVNKDKFSIDAEGNINSVGGLRMLGNGITVRANGLTTANGITVIGTLTVNTQRVSSDLNPARFLDSSNTVQITGGLKVTYDQNTAITNGLRVYNGGINIGKGGIVDGSNWDIAYINDNGIKVGAGGGTVSAGGLYVTDGITLGAGGITGFIRSTVNLRDWGLSIANGLTIQGQQVKVGKVVSGYYGGLVFNNVPTQGTTINLGGLTLTGGFTSTTNGLKVTGGLTIQSEGLNIVTKGFTLNSGGLVVNGGITLSPTPSPAIANNLVVSAGGLLLGGHYDISQSFIVNGGATVYTDGLKVLTSGLTITTEGVYVATKGMTVTNDGIYVTAKGFTVNNGGLLVQDGISSKDGGLAVTQGVTIAAEGLYITAKGLTVRSQGLRLDGSPQSNIVNGGIQVGSTGLLVTGGITLNDEGLMVTTKGLTVTSEGLYVTAKGLTIQNLGLKLTLGGLSISNKLAVTSPTVNQIKNGLTLIDGLTVDARGLYITTKGVTITNGGLQATAGGFLGKDLGLKVTDGLVISDGGLTSTQILNIKDSGLVVSHKGLTVNNLGVYINDMVTVGTTYGATSTATAFKVLTRGLKVTSDTDFNQVTGSMRASNGTTIASGGIQATGGLTVRNQGVFVISKGMSISTLGLKVYGGIVVQNGAVSVTGPAVITATPALSMTKGMTVLDSGIVITTKGITVSKDGLLISAKGLTIQNSGLLLPAGGLTVNDQGLIVASALTVKNLNLLTDSLTIQAGGLKVQSNFLISGGLNIADGLTVKDVGLIVATKGITISKTGLVVTTKGLTINQEGLVVTGVSQLIGSLQVSDGITIDSNGLVYDNTLGGSLSADYADVTGTITIYNNGLKVTQKSGHNQVNDMGLKVLQGGLTVYGIVTGFCNGCSDYMAANAISSPWSNNVLMPGTVSGTALPAFSDKSIKSNFTKINDSIGIVRKLRGFTYNWIDDPPDGFQFDKKKHLGLMAQDVQDVLPDLVMSRNNTYLEVNYMEIIPLLVDAISQLKNRIENDNCETEYSSKLINDIYSLRSQISSLEIEYDAFRKELDINK